MPHVTGTSWPKSVMSHHVQICDAGASELTPNTRPSRKGRGEALWWCFHPPGPGGAWVGHVPMLSVDPQAHVHAD